MSDQVGNPEDRFSHNEAYHTLLLPRDAVKMKVKILPGLEVIKLFSCSTQLSSKFKLLINVEITRINGIFRGAVKMKVKILPGPKVIKLFSCSTQLSSKSKLLINVEISRNDGIFRFKASQSYIYPADKC